MIDQKLNQPFDALCCSGVVPGHCAVIRQSTDEAGQNMVEFLYVGPIEHSIDPAGCTVVIDPATFDRIKQAENKIRSMAN